MFKKQSPPPTPSYPNPMLFKASRVRGMVVVILSFAAALASAGGVLYAIYILFIEGQWNGYLFALLFPLALLCVGLSVSMLSLARRVFSSTYGFMLTKKGIVDRGPSPGRPAGIAWEEISTLKIAVDVRPRLGHLIPRFAHNVVVVAKNPKKWIAAQRGMRRWSARHLNRIHRGGVLEFSGDDFSPYSAEQLIRIIADYYAAWARDPKRARN